MSFLHLIDKFVLPGNRNSTPCCRDVFRIGTYSGFTQPAFTREQKKNVRKLYKVNNKNKETTSMTLFWCHYC